MTDTMKCDGCAGVGVVDMTTTGLVIRCGRCWGTGTLPIGTHGVTV